MTKNIPNLAVYSYIGSASSGKSSSLTVTEAKFKEVFKSDPNIVGYFDEEAATKVLQIYGGIDNTTLSFQFLVIHNQLRGYEKVLEFAKANPDKFVVYVVDRSLLDGMLYIPEESQKCIGFNHFAPLYDHFFYFDFDKKFVKETKENNEFRKENNTDALLELSERTKELYWKSGIIDTAKITLIPCSESLEEKTTMAADLTIRYIKKAKEAFEKL